MAPFPLPLADHPAARTPAVRRFLAALFRYPPWAHHPTCACFDAHLIRLGSLALCLGCVCMAVGAVVSMVALLWAWQHERWLVHGWGLFALGLLLYLPTLVQPFWQWKPFKASARFLLGASLPLLLLSGLVLPPLTPLGFGLRAGFVALFAGCFVLAMRLRKRFTPDPCAACPHGRFPLCRDNSPRLRSLLERLRQQEPDFAAQVVEMAESDPARALAELGRCRAV